MGYFKVGLGLLNTVGYQTDIIKKITANGGKVFLDCKLHDIPNTIAAATKGITRQLIKMFNLHIMGGNNMIRAAIKASEEEAKKLGVERPMILGVTLLTSIDKDDMNNQLRIPGDTGKHVAELALIAEQTGLNGVIASPHEIEVIRNTISSDLLIVTPGIRPSYAASNDQKRTMTPAEAISKGATHIVIGRPITKPPKYIGSSINAVKTIIKENGGMHLTPVHSRYPCEYTVFFAHSSFIIKTGLKVC